MKRSVLEAGVYAAIFSTALLAIVRFAGASPIAWIDTFNDESEVLLCRLQSACTLVGMKTSVQGLVHAVAWLEWRTLAAWLGASLSVVHVIVLVLTAFSGLLVFHVARRLGGFVAGALAFGFWLSTFAWQIEHATALYNTSPLLALGAIMLVSATAVVERPNWISFGLFALVVAVVANVHLACAVQGLSVVGLVWSTSKRPVLSTVFVAGVFSVVCVAIAPPSWMQNVVSILAQSPRSAHGLIGPPSLNPLIAWALGVAFVWAGSWLGGSERLAVLRHRLKGSLALLVPFVFAFLAGPMLGLNPDTKYLAHLPAALSVAVGVVGATIIEAILGYWRSERLRWNFGGACLLLSFAVVGSGVFAVPIPKENPMPTIRDLTVTVEQLHTEFGWGAAQLLRRVRSPHGLAVSLGLWELARGLGQPSDSRPDEGTTLSLLALRAPELPQRLPDDWKILRDNGDVTVMLLEMPSRVDWNRFEVCFSAGSADSMECLRSEWPNDESATAIRLAAMPSLEQARAGILRLRYRVRPLSTGEGEIVFMPRLPNLCGGAIVEIVDGVAMVDADRRRAVIESTEPEGATLVLEWKLGSSECPSSSYEGLPPYFIAAASSAARSIEAVLREQEG